MVLPLPTCNSPFFIPSPPNTPFSFLGHLSFPSYTPPPTHSNLSVAGRKGKGPREGQGNWADSQIQESPVGLSWGPRLRSSMQPPYRGAATKAHVRHKFSNVAQAWLCQPLVLGGVQRKALESQTLSQKSTAGLSGSAIGQERAMCVGPTTVGD